LGGTKHFPHEPTKKLSPIWRENAREKSIYINYIFYLPTFLFNQIKNFSTFPLFHPSIKIKMMRKNFLSMFGWRREKNDDNA